MKAQEIGHGRTYETMVFILHADGNVNPDPIDMIPANSDEDADKNHIKLCLEYARKGK